MNLNGYSELQNALDVAAVDAQVANCPKEGEDLRFITVDIEIEGSSDEPMACVADVMNAFVASGHISTGLMRDEGLSYRPELKLLGFTEESILFEDTNTSPPDSYELR